MKINDIDLDVIRELLSVVPKNMEINSIEFVDDEYIVNFSIRLKGKETTYLGSLEALLDLINAIS